MPRGGYRRLNRDLDDFDQLFLRREYYQREPQNVTTLKLFIFIILIYLFLQAENMRQLQLRNGHISAFGKGHREFVLQNANPRVAAYHQQAEAPANPDENPTGLKYKGIILHGVPEALLKSYRPDPETLKWSCLNNPDVILDWKQVNDDVCDCPDSSDEPGTNACNNGHFFCEKEKRYISSSKVNDGICDCCDGADEWKGIELDSNTHTFPPDARRVPCMNFCHEFELEKEAKEDIERQGKEIKNNYYLPYFTKNPNAINTDTQYNTKIFGPDHVYLKVSQTCFHYRSPTYLYELCPYRISKQKDGDGKEYKLGVGYSDANDNMKQTLDPSKFSDSLNWEGDNLLAMGNGDMCPGDNPRKTKIKFVCGTVDQILYVNEVDTCVYQFDFSSPAAC